MMIHLKANKHFSVLIALLVIFLLTVACSYQETEDGEGGVNRLREKEISRLHMVADGNKGIISQSYPQYGEYMYELFDRSDHSNIIITDVENGVRSYLSSDMTVPRYLPENSSYLPVIYGLHPLLCLDGKLAVLRISSQLLVRSYGESALPRLYTMDYNGENREKVFTLKANQWINWNGGVAADEEYLYMIVNELSEKDLSERAYLLKISYHTGERKILCDVDKRNPAKIISAYDDTIVLQAYNLDDPSKLYIEQTKTMYFTLYGVDRNTGEKHEIMDIHPAEMFHIAYDDKLVYIDRLEWALKEYDYRTGTINNITDLPNGYDYYGARYDKFDDHLFVVCYHEGDELGELYWVDLVTGETKPVTITYNGEFVGIYAESKDMFLVSVGKKKYMTREYGKGGEEMLVEAETPDFRLIRKEDYWNNDPKLIDIKDLVYTDEIIR